MQKTISTDLTPANIARVLELLRETPEKLKALSKLLSVEKLRQPLGADERSLTEDLAHLINSEARTSEAIYLALLVDEPLIADIHSERDWGKLLRFDLLDFPELLAYFKIRRKVLLRILSALTEAQWSRPIREEGKKRKESIYWRARSLALHESEHVSDLERKIG
ncbi:MAG: DinB family protein [Anaerolineales bacterium]|uniref:DinB family protein n=1 Tax=Candidatus Villigracilis affinis TaxID=3140682 RepID=UPI001D7C75D4|nr:DinB family protein [Anaerolineales bacterium]MBK9601551.1 DinB family protein [Anaerolineales bacterium]MBL0345412.1 DinB family protein [Anaerolineales bacterium]